MLVLVTPAVLLAPVWAAAGGCVPLHRCFSYIVTPCQPCPCGLKRPGLKRATDNWCSQVTQGLGDAVLPTTDIPDKASGPIKAVADDAMIVANFGSMVP